LGLTSLAYLNRSGTYNYWDDSWDSIKNYKHYLYGGFFVKNLINELLRGSFFNLIYIVQNNKFKQFGYLGRYKLVNSYFYKNIFFGKIWYLKYQNWLVVVVHYYDTKGFLLNFKKNGNQPKKFAFKKKYNILWKQKNFKNYNFIF